MSSPEPSPLMKALPIIGLVLAVISAVLGLLQVVLTDFVNAEFLTNEEGTGTGEITQRLVFANLGVYRTEYDTTTFNQANQQATSLPIEKYEVPTGEFELLFPAQENFLPKANAINQDLVDSFPLAFQEVLNPLIGEQIDAVNNLEFETCAQYLADAQVAQTELYNEVNNEIMPKLYPFMLDGTGAISEQVIPGLTAIISGTASTNLDTAAGAVNPVLALFAGALPTFFGAAVTPNPDCAQFVGTTATSQVSNQVFNCLSTGISAVASTLDLSETQNQATAAFMSIVAQAVSACSDVLVINCLAQSGTVLNPAVQNLVGTTNFFGGNVNICDQLNAINGVSCTSKAEYMGILNLVFSVAAEEFNPALANAAAGAGLYALAVNNLAPAMSTFTEVELIDLFRQATLGQDLSNPANFIEYFLGCGVVSTLAGNLLADASQCTFPSFFETSIALARTTGSDQVALLESLQQLYGGCALVSPADFSRCGELFGPLFVNGMYDFPFENTNVLTSAAVNVTQTYNSFNATCEDDVEDLEKITAGALMVGAALALYFLAVLLDLKGVVDKNQSGFVTCMGGIILLIAGLVNFGALLVVSTAPIYDSVGEEKAIGEVEYVSGIIPTLALIALILSILGGLCSCIAGAKGWRAEDQQMTKEVVDAKVVQEVDAEKQELAAVNTVAEVDAQAEQK